MSVQTPAEILESEFTLKLPPEEVLKARQEEDARDAREKRALRVRELQGNANLPKRHSKRFVDRSGDWGMKEQILHARLGKGFLIALVGIRGNGKTQLGVELIRHATQSLATATYCTAMDFFFDIKATYRKEAVEQEKHVIKRLRAPRLLVLDEIGKRSDTEWESQMLCYLIDLRYRDETDTLLIANQTPEQFKTALDPSIISRLNETGGLIECDWESFRDREELDAARASA